MDISQRKEQFSQAFIQGVANVAGYAIYKPAVDDDMPFLMINGGCFIIWILINTISRHGNGKSTSQGQGTEHAGQCSTGHCQLKMNEAYAAVWGI